MKIVGGTPNMTAPRCALCAHEAESELLVCLDHKRALGRMLDPTVRHWTPDENGGPVLAPSIPVLYARLSPVPAVADRIVGGRSPFASKSPANDDVIALGDLRSAPDADGHGSYSVLGVLGALVVQLGGPTLQSAWGCGAWLTDNLGALCAAENVREAFRALSTLHDRLRRLSGDPGPKYVARCTNPVNESQKCGTAIYGPERATRGDDERVPSLASIQCSGCGHHWSALELRTMVRERRGAA